MNKFIRSVYEMASDEQANSVAVGFSADGLSLELRDVDALAEILPKYFNHNKVASLCRQLNNYGFRKLHPGRLARANSGNNSTDAKRAAIAITQTFIHPQFQRNRPDLCGQIRRQTANTAKQFLTAEDESDGEDDGEVQPAIIPAAAAAAAPSNVGLQFALNNAVQLNNLLQQQNLDLMKRIRDLEQTQQKCTCRATTVSNHQLVLPLSFPPQVPPHITPIATADTTTPAKASPTSAISARRNSSDDSKLMFEFPPFL